MINSVGGRLILERQQEILGEEQVANVVGSNGRDFVSTVFKTQGVNTLTTDRADLVDMLAGNDAVLAGAGHDTVFGRQGNDRLFGEGRGDTLSGNDGGDHLDGGRGNDRLFGDTGNDLLVGRLGNDALFGGAGDDVSIGGAGNDFIQEDDTGNDRLFGGAGDDIFFGGAGDDRLRGGAGNDFMRGMGGDDRIRGGSGQDAVIGDGGDDRLRGGAGSDGFVFERPVLFDVSATDKDVILDFTKGEDKIRLLGFGPEATQFSDLDISMSREGSVIELSGFFGSSLGTHTITVLNVTNLASSDFLFA
jgi:Ca2+-binding RTX toxin-like protein